LGAFLKVGKAKDERVDLDKTQLVGKKSLGKVGATIHGFIQ
jgi:hypothetical protein